MKVWILTLILAGHAHHYCDGCVYATKESCEQVLSMMKVLNPGDYGVAEDSVCRPVEIQK